MSKEIMQQGWGFETMDRLPFTPYFILVEGMTALLSSGSWPYKDGSTKGLNRGGKQIRRRWVNESVNNFNIELNSRKTDTVQYQNAPKTEERRMMWNTLKWEIYITLLLKIRWSKIYENYHCTRSKGKPDRFASV